MKRLLLPLLLLLALFQGAQGAITCTHIATLTSDTDQSTFNFGNVTVPADGLLVAVAMGNASGSRTVSSISLGGTNGTLVAANSSAHSSPHAIGYRAVTAGARNVTVNFSYTTLRCVVDVYLLEGYNSATPYDSDFLAAGTSTTAAVSLDFPTNGVALYGTSTANGTATVSWSAATEDAESARESAWTAAAAHKTASGASNTETATWTASATRVGFGAVWEPAPTNPPTITTGTNHSVVEETGLVVVAAATSDTTITWSINGGADASLFTINSSTGELRFKSPPDYTDPQDSGTNNVYVVTVRATNLSLLYDEETLNITVTQTVSRTGLLKPDDVTTATLEFGYDCRFAECLGGSFPDDGTTTTWVDRIGSADLLTNGGALLPRYYKDQANGFGTLKVGDGTDTRGLRAEDCFSGTWTTFSWIVVFKNDASSGNDTLIECDDSACYMRSANSGGRLVYDIGYARGTGYRVIGCTQNTATFSTGVPPGLRQIWIDGCCFGSGNAAGVGTVGSNDTLVLGSEFHSSQDHVAAVYIYRGALSVVEMAQVQRYLMMAFGVAPHSSGKAIVASCNSLTAGGSVGSWVARVATDHLYDDEAIDVEHYNIAQTGGGTATLGRQSSMFDDLRADLSARGVKAVFTMWHGHNDGLNTSNVIADIESYPVDWRADGHRVISMTLSPSNNGMTNNGTSWTAMYNWHNASSGPYIDLWANTRELDFMDEITDPVTRTDMYSDGLHLLSAGQAAVADWMAPKILAQFESMDATPKPLPPFLLIR